MYLILNYLPVLAQLFICGTAVFANFNYNIDFVLYAFLNLFGMPIYLLLINIFCIIRKNISYKLSIICMLTAILLNVLILLISHKITYGVFLGDIPEGIIYLLIIIPSVVVLIGIIFFIFVKRFR